MTGSGDNKVYWDTCIFYHLLNRKTTDTAFLEEIDKLVNRLHGGDVIICTSTLVHIEASAERLKQSPKKQALLKGLYAAIEMINANSRVIKLAAEIRDFYAAEGNTLSTPDVIHLASAIYYDIREFHTCDGTNPEAGRGKLLTLRKPIAGKYDINIIVPRAKQPSLLTGLKGISQTASPTASN